MRILALTLALWVATPAAGAMIVLDFEEEPLARYEGSPFVSAECGCVQFSQYSRYPGYGGEVSVFDFRRVGSRMLLVGEEGGDLLMEFLVPVVGLSLDFSTFFDEPDVWLDDAHLTAYAGGQVVGEATFTPDPNGPLFQTISLFPGTVIERAVYRKYDLGEYEPNSVLVDNIVLTVPEPRALPPVGLLLAAVAFRRRIRLHA